MKPCPIRGCHRNASEDQLMCYVHWDLVPKVLQTLIWRLWSSGKPKDGYGEAVSNAIEQVNARVAKRAGSS